MPMEYAFCSTPPLALVRYRGRIDPQVIIRSFQRYVEHPLYAPGMDELADLSQLTEIDLDYTTMRAVLKSVNAVYTRLPTRTRISFFAPEDVGFGMARMFEQLAGLQNGARAFVSRTEAEALAALDRPERRIADVTLVSASDPL